jgi:hypothetical protein
MDRSEHEATLNLLGWTCCRMNISGRLVAGMTRDLSFLYCSRAEHGLSLEAYRRYIDDGQTAVAEDWDIFSDYELMILCQKARWIDSEEAGDGTN